MLFWSNFIGALSGWNGFHILGNFLQKYPETKRYNYVYTWVIALIGKRLWFVICDAWLTPCLHVNFYYVYYTFISYPLCQVELSQIGGIQLLRLVQNSISTPHFPPFFPVE